MVQMIVDPAAHIAFDVGEIQHHPAMIELVGHDGNHRPAIVAVQIPALSRVIQQTMSVTEIDLASHAIHDPLP